jgi:hypothetical protein
VMNMCTRESDQSETVMKYTVSPVALWYLTQNKGIAAALFDVCLLSTCSTDRSSTPLHNPPPFYVLRSQLCCP